MHAHVDEVHILYKEKVLELELNGVGEGRLCLGSFCKFQNLLSICIVDDIVNVVKYYMFLFYQLMFQLESKFNFFFIKKVWNIIF